MRVCEASCAGSSRRGGALKIVRAGEQEPWGPGKGPLDQVGVLQRCGVATDRQVKAFADHVDQPLRGDFDDADLGVVAQKGRQDPAQRKLRQLHGYRDANDAAWFSQPLPHGFLGNLRALQQATAYW